MVKAVFSVLGLVIGVVSGNVSARGEDSSRVAVAAPSSVTVDFTATVRGVHPLLPDLAGLVGRTGVGHIRYNLDPVATSSFSECRIYYFDQPDRAFSFELPAADLALQAGASQDHFNVEICDGFTDLVDNGELVLVDRIRSFALGIGEQLGSYDIATLVVRFADSTATAVSDMSLSNILVPDRYDIRNFWIMIALGGGRTTAGLTFSIDSVTVREPSPGDGCPGDCNGDGQVTIGELILGVNISLGAAAAGECGALDTNSDGAVTIEELVQAVRNALRDCSPLPLS